MTVKVVSLFKYASLHRFKIYDTRDTEKHFVGEFKSITRKMEEFPVPLNDSGDFEVKRNIVL